MSPLRRLERSLQPYAIQNLTLILIAGQVAVYFSMILRPDAAELLDMRPQLVLEGQVWRLITFLVDPAIREPLDPWTIFFFIIAMMVLHLMGSALEAEMGALRYNAFIFVGYLASIGSSLLLSAVFGGDQAASNLYLYGSIFLAFAWLHPDFQMMLFFIVPVKVKWLALLTVVLLTLQFLAGLASFRQGGWVDCVLILAGNINISLFFGRDIAERLRRGNARMIRKMGNLAQQPAGPRHTCAVCGATERTNPEREFRYCTECDGTPGYCDLHLAGHTHRVPGAPPHWAGKK